MSEQEDQSGAVVSSVAHQVLDGFLVELEKKDGYSDIAKRLREAVFASAGFNEISVRKALFEEKSA